MTDRHEVSSSTEHEEYIGRILGVIDGDSQVSQRSISRELGIALGLTNLLVRRLTARGLVRVSKIQPHRVKYLLTPAGIAEKTRMSQMALKAAIDRYQLARQRVREVFEIVSTSWPGATDQKSIVFYGTGELAEIGFICLQETDLRLVGACDDTGRERFFGVKVYPFESLSGALLASLGGAHLVVLSLTDRHSLTRELERRGIQSRLVHWA